jgi:hypothetical protein
VPFVADVTTTFTPGTAAPEGSVTVPKMLPKTACAAACGVNNAQLNANNANAQRTVENFFIAASPPSSLFVANSVAREKNSRVSKDRADDVTLLEDLIRRFCPCSELRDWLVQKH